jgi:hypothetical protein
LPFAIVAVERQQRPDPCRDRARERDLERPQQIAPGRAQKQDQDAAEERRPISHAAAHKDEQQHGAEQEE